MIEHLKRRQDFLDIAKCLVCARKTCVVQARDRADDDPARIGFTVTKKLGNAVTRNRIKRRLREAVRVGSGVDLKPGHDYVFIGRAATLNQEFEQLIKDLADAVDRLNKGITDPPRKTGRGRNRGSRSQRS